MYRHLIVPSLTPRLLARRRRQRMAALALFVLLWAMTALGLADSGDQLAQARQLVAERQFIAASIVLKDLLQADPDAGAARVELGRVYLHQRQAEAARKEFETALAARPDLVEARLGLAEAWLLLGDLDAVLEQIASLDGSDPATRILSGRLALAQGRTEAARDAFTQAAAALPQDPWPAYGLALLATEETDPQSSLEALEQVIADFPDFTEARLLRAELHHRQGEHADALAHLDRLLASDPEDLAARAMRAEALISLDRMTEAAAELDAIARLGRVSSVPYMQAVMAFQAGDWAEALARIDGFLGVAPRHPNALALAGLAHLYLGHSASALSHLERAVSAQPGNLIARRGLAMAYLAADDPRRAATALAPVAAVAPVAEVIAVAQALVDAGAPASAEPLIEIATAAAPSERAIMLRLAQVQAASGDYTAAIATLNAYLDDAASDWQVRAQLAEVQWAAGEVTAAIAVAAALAEEFPDNPALVALHGRLLLASGQDPVQGRALLEQAARLDPPFLPALLALGDLALAAGDREEAATWYGRAEALAPEDLPTLLRLAALAEQTGDQAAIGRWLGQAQRAHPDSIEVGVLMGRHRLNQGDRDGALALAAELYARAPQQRQVLEYVVQTELLSGRSEHRYGAVGTLVRAYPDAPGVRKLAAQSALADDDLDTAIMHLRRAVDLAPTDQLARIALTQALLAQGDYAAALDGALVLQEQYPDSASGYELEGLAWLAQQRFEAAVPVLQEAMGRHRGPTVVRQLAGAYAETDQLAEAIALLQDWLQEQPTDLRTQAQLGDLLRQDGDAEGAIAAYRAAADGGLEQPALLNNLAYLLHQQGADEALAIARRAYEVAPDHPLIADTYGWILVSQGDLARGLDLLMEAHLNQPDEPLIAYHLAYALAQAGRGAEAAARLRQLLAQQPAHADAETWRALLAQIEG